MRMSLATLLFAAAVVFAPALHASGAVRDDGERRLALLIGASNYPVDSIGADVSLLGPKNDVALLIRALRAAGVPDEDMIVLADGLEETGVDRAADGMPTHAEILAAFADMSGRVRPGDSVLVYFSGHGSRQPQLPGHPPERIEANGYDEIFLPLDIGRWQGAQDDRQAGVENALIDDDIGEFINGLRARDAFVWLVVDTCHSGTADRSGGGGEWRTREVLPEMLGIPGDAIAHAETVARASRAAGPSRPEGPVSVGGGGIVAFFAAHSGQLALEGPLPRTARPGERKNHGLLTYQVAQALLSGEAGTYRDLAYRVLNGYDDWGARAPAPLFEGELDRPVFGLGEAGERAWPVERMDTRRTVVGAGALDGVGEGAVFRLNVIDPDTGGSHPSFPGPYFMQAAEVGQTQTVAELAAYGGEPAARRVPPYGFLTASLEDSGVRWTVSVALERAPARPAAAERRALDALAALRAAAPETLNAPVEWTDDPGGADVRIAIDGGRAWLMRGAEMLTRSGRFATPSIDLEALASVQDARAAIERELRGVARARNLIRAATALQDGPGMHDLFVRGYLYRASPPARLPETARAPDDWACSLPDARNIPQGAVAFTQMGASLLDVMDVRHCDIIYLEIYNAGETPVDVTPLYIDAMAGVHRMPYLGDDRVRIEPGAPPRVVWAGISSYDWTSGTPAPVGLERLVLLAVRRDAAASLPWDFAYLTQPALPATRSGGGSGLERFLNDAAFGGGTTRSAHRGGALDDRAGAMLFQWRVLPPDGAE